MGDKVKTSAKLAQKGEITFQSRCFSFLLVSAPNKQSLSQFIAKYNKKMLPEISGSTNTKTKLDLCFIVSVTCCNTKGKRATITLQGTNEGQNGTL